MIKIQRVDGNYHVMKNNSRVGVVRKALASERSDWGNWLLVSSAGRIDRAHTYQEIKSEALKL